MSSFAPRLFSRRGSVWHDPVRRYRTLLAFSQTEADGGDNLLLAAARVDDEELRGHLLKHADDEVRHARLFKQRAAEVRAEVADAGAADGAHSDKAWDLPSDPNQGERDAHGFLDDELLDERGEVSYVAMLHVAELNAEKLFKRFAEQNAHDPGTREVFEKILKDERYHVAYTGMFLDRWRQQGFGAEVDRALKASRSSRLMGAWRRLGLRSAAGTSQLLLRVLYLTVLAPFGLLASRKRAAAGWQAPAVPSELSSQA